MRRGEPGDWVTDDPSRCDRSLFQRLVARIAYGGRKGRRAFLRLWRLRVRPPAHRVTFTITGFEL